jgi:cytochrome c peroxidase
MKKRLILSMLGLAVLVQFAWQSGEANHPASEKLRSWLLTELAQTHAALSQIPLSQNPTARRESYREARRHYKRVEFFVEYCSPREAKYLINGPLVPKHDPDVSPDMQEPRGFQVIEELLYTAELPDTVRLNAETRALSEQVATLAGYYGGIEMADGVLLEMCQLQLFRIAALNLNGYDATFSLTNVEETDGCLEGLEEVIRCFASYADRNSASRKNHQALLRQLAQARKALQRHLQYDTFDRLPFITGHVNPLNRLLVAFHQSCGLPWTERQAAIQLKAGFLFGKESFDLRFFSMYFDDTLHLPAQAQLGKQLFFDPILSGNNQVSCATCHQPARAFTDGFPTRQPGSRENGEKAIARNTPTLLNVALQKAFFYDGRAYQLEQQVTDVVHNPHEMQGDLEQAVLRLRQLPTYRQRFAQAFPASPDSAITPYAIQKALTEYEKTLISFNSQFDRYLRGDKQSLNKREIRGYNLFAGKALCGSCHFFPLFNGTVPPAYNDSEFEVIGTAATADNRQLDADEGRGPVTGLDAHRFAFKTPTVRNVALTAPYMHNGAYTTLEQIIEFYHRGGGKGMGFPLEHQTLPFDSLSLTATDKQDLLLFLHTLTDTTNTTAHPLVFPLFDEPKTTKRSSSTFPR